MSDISLNLYRTFCVVAEKKSYVEASRVLNVGETTVGTHIKQLEDNLGVLLFYRGRNKIEITPEGQKVYDLFNAKIKDLEFMQNAFIQEVNDISNAKVTIGCPSHITMAYLTECIVEAKKEYPDITIDVIGVDDYFGLMNKLQKHIIDFIVMDIVPQNEYSELVVEELKKVNNIFVYNKPLKIENLEELQNYHFILNYENSKSSQELRKVLEWNDIEINATLHCDATEIRIEEASSGLQSLTPMYITINHYLKQIMKKVKCFSKKL